MTDGIGLGLQLAGNAARFGWYSGVNWLLSREGRRHGSPPRYRPERPVPSQRELFADLARLFRADAELVGDGILPASLEPAESLGEHLARLRAMFRDLPETVRRRQSRAVDTARQSAEAAAMPDYFTQDFHFQTGGYLSEDSARLYDVQVETLFYGAAAAMRRAALRPIARHLLGRDQRRAALLDVACGTGRLLRDIRLAFPALQLAGLDLSRPYLAEAERHLGGLRPVTWIAANAEAIPLSDASQDIVTSVFLFHELPPEVRRRVAAEMARVLKPGGMLVLVDSLQMGDRPEWDGLIEAFPHRFHEPYYRHYAIDDLDRLLDAAGLAAVETSQAFLSKVMVRRMVP
jgi:ubiquinone/menaquinone biosynthesis C-methylase UbiE